jgi:[ribosomal protein S5]-alanine N-acetyltransferase
MTASGRPPPPRLETDRLLLRLAAEEDVEEIARYFSRNRDFLRPFDPRRPEVFFSPTFWSGQVRQSVADERMDRAVRFFLFDRETGEIIGTANFTQIRRGVSHSCTLGYGLSEAHQGRGLMREALQPAIEHVFDVRRLHRIEANYMPHNLRSGKLLRRLGFSVDGYARDYLLIDGKWEDHILTSLTNLKWGSDGPGDSGRE